MIHYTSESAAPRWYRQVFDKPDGTDLPATRSGSPDIDRLIAPTWAEIDELRDRYERDAKRFRAWRWWFVGMFTLYTTLVGILLLKLFTGI